MSVLLVPDFLAIEGYSKYSREDPATIQFWLDRSERYVAKDLFDDSRDWEEAVMLLTAHCLEVERQQQIETAGQASAIASGSSTRPSFGDANYFSQTVYGRRYLALLRSNVIGFVAL